MAKAVLVVFLSALAVAMAYKCTTDPNVDGAEDVSPCHNVDNGESCGVGGQEVWTCPAGQDPSGSCECRATQPGVVSWICGSAKCVVDGGGGSSTAPQCDSDPTVDGAASTDNCLSAEDGEKCGVGGKYTWTCPSGKVPSGVCTCAASATSKLWTCNQASCVDSDGGGGGGGGSCSSSDCAACSTEDTCKAASCTWDSTETKCKNLAEVAGSALETWIIIVIIVASVCCCCLVIIPLIIIICCCCCAAGAAAKANDAHQQHYQQMGRK